MGTAEAKHLQNRMCDAVSKQFKDFGTIRAKKPKLQMSSWLVFFLQGEAFFPKNSNRISFT